MKTTRGTDGCVEWQGTRTGGYGMMWRGSRMWLVHRLAYEDEVGPIPAGLLVLHKCDNPACYNVDHLYLGTQRDNMRDRDTRGRNGHKAKTHCPQGHPYDEANTRVCKGRRHCRACNRLRVRPDGKDDPR